MNKLIPFLVSILTVQIASADQCAYLDKQTATAAAQSILKGQDIKFLCEPCGETVASKVDLKTLSINKVNIENFWEISINGKNIDLAYTFVDGKNLAIKSGCPVEGVSPLIK